MYMLVKEAAIYICEHESTLRNKARKGEIKAFKKGKIWLFTSNDLDTYVEQFKNAYATSVRHENKEEFFTCQSKQKNQSSCTKGGIHGTSHTASLATREEYAKALGLVIKR